MLQQMAGWGGGGLTCDFLIFLIFFCENSLGSECDDFEPKFACQLIASKLVKGFCCRSSRVPKARRACGSGLRSCDCRCQCPQFVRANRARFTTRAAAAHGICCKQVLRIMPTGPTAQQVADLGRQLACKYMTLRDGTWIFLCLFILHCLLHLCSVQKHRHPSRHTQSLGE
jgi:hypothetical protein